jgi:hypothetical protein
MLVAADAIAAIGKAIRILHQRIWTTRLKTWEMVELIEAEPIDQLLDHETSAVRSGNGSPRSTSAALASRASAATSTNCSPQRHHWARARHCEYRLRSRQIEKVFFQPIRLKGIVEHAAIQMPSPDRERLRSTSRPTLYFRVRTYSTSASSL